MMLPDVLFAAGVVSLLIGLWPFGPYQLTLILAHKLCRFPSALEPSPVALPIGDSFAICVCAYNEAATIVDKIEDLLRLRGGAGGELDILVYVDGATDNTAALVEPYRDRVRLVIESSRRGKTHGMNLLVNKTEASIVMFTDANVRIDPEAVAVLRRYFADPTIGCVCSHLTYVNASQSATAFVGSAFWSFNEWSKGLETATGSVIGADGSLFAIRRCVHRPVPDGLIDDIYVSLSTLLAGFRVVRAPELRAYETHTTAAADEFRRKIRIASQSMHIHFALWPELRRLDAWHVYKYIGHRLLRWIGGYILAVGVILLAAAALLKFGAVTVTAVGGIGLAFFVVAVGARFGPARALLNVLLALAGNVIGVWQAFCGVRAITWEPPSSARGGKAPGSPSSQTPE